MENSNDQVTDTLPSGVAVPMSELVIDKTHAALALFRLFIAVDGLFTQMRRRLEVGPNERLALEFLWEYGPMPMSELADRLAVTRAAVTTLIDRMEESGFIVRMGDVRDRRRTIVSLSPDAITRMCEAMEPWVGGVADALGDLDDVGWAVVGGKLAALHAVTNEESDRQRAISIAAN